MALITLVIVWLW